VDRPSRPLAGKTVRIDLNAAFTNGQFGTCRFADANARMADTQGKSVNGVQELRGQR